MMTRLLSTTLAAAIALTLASAAPAAAQTAPAAAREAINACKDDYQRFCKDVSPGGGRILACLKNHSSELGPACAKALGR